MDTNIRKRTFQDRQEVQAVSNKQVYKSASISNLINHDSESSSQEKKVDKSHDVDNLSVSPSTLASSSSSPIVLDPQDTEPDRVAIGSQHGNISADTIVAKPTTNEEDTLLAATVLGNLKNSSSSSTVNTLSTSVDLPTLNNRETLESNHIHDCNVNSLPVPVVPNFSANQPSTYSYNNVQLRFFDKVSTYYQSSKDYSPAFKVGAEYVEKKAMPLVRRFELQRKKTLLTGPQDIRKANNKTVAGAMNLNYLLNKQQQNRLLSVQLESKKNLRVLLKILKLANNRLSDKIDNLQHMIILREQALNRKYEDGSLDADEKHNDDDDDIDEFHDASSELNHVKRRKRNPSVSSITSNGSASDFIDNKLSQMNDKKNNSNGGLYQIKKDIVITVKKAVDIVSKFTGSSLPEPARSNVREVLLKLPVNLSKALHTELTPMNSVPGSPVNQNADHMVMSTPPNLQQGVDLNFNSPKNITGFGNFDANRKILILAKESLDSFANIIKIFDNNLEKVENWVVDNQENTCKNRSVIANPTAITDEEISNEKKIQTTPSPKQQQEQQQ